MHTSASVEAPRKGCLDCFYWGVGILPAIILHLDNRGQGCLPPKCALLVLLDLHPLSLRCDIEQAFCPPVQKN